MKAERSDRRLLHRAGGGVTLVEIAIVICLVGVIAGVFYRMVDRQIVQTNSDDKSSKYYLDLSLFVESLQADLAMTRAVHPESEGVSLLVNTDGVPASITYALKKNTVERAYRGSTKVFGFTHPNKSGSPLIFRIEEVQP